MLAPQAPISAEQTVLAQSLFTHVPQSPTSQLVLPPEEELLAVLVEVLDEVLVEVLVEVVVEVLVVDDVLPPSSLSSLSFVFLTVQAAANAPIERKTIIQRQVFILSPAICSQSSLPRCTAASSQSGVEE